MSADVLDFTRPIPSRVGGRMMLDQGRYRLRNVEDDHAEALKEDYRLDMIKLDHAIMVQDMIAEVEAFQA